MSDFSGFATGWDEGTANEKVKPVFIGVVSMVVDSAMNGTCWAQNWLMVSAMDYVESRYCPAGHGWIGMQVSH